MGSLNEISFKALIKSFERIGVAYSGGLDSTVLLHLLSREIAFLNKVNAVHINHSINPDSDKWEEFCRKNADELECNSFPTN